LVQAIIDAVKKGALAYELIGLITDKSDAEVITRCQNSKIPHQIILMLKDRAEWDRKIFAATEQLKPDLIVSAGFMRILSGEYVARFKVINTHPALLPLFPGAHAVRDTLAAGAVKTGATVHWVDAGMDTGKVIAQSEVEITATDTESSLHERIKIAERRLIVEVLHDLLPEVKAE
jgi:phosphoribosylglycinamide formyltransferase-1